jgi:glutaredoxin
MVDSKVCHRCRGLVASSVLGLVVGLWVPTAPAEPLPAPPPPASDAPRGDRRGAGAPIDVYVAPWCGYCRALENDLRGRGIPFFRHDIEADARAKREYAALGGSGVPLTKVGSEVVNGYDLPAILRLLGRAR